MKTITTLILVLIGIVAQAQFTTAWTFSNDMPANKIPSGFSVPVLDELDDPNIIRFSISLDATTYDNANRSTALTALMTALKTEIDSNYIPDIWTLDTSSTSTMNIVVRNYDRDWTLFDCGDPLDILLADEDVFIITGYVAYKKDEE